jgi:DNA-binding NtrC family response regulator
MPDNDMRATILVVEDETLVRLHGVCVLEDAGFKVLEASNADDALAALAMHDDVLLVFSDVDMPGTMDGLALVRLVHQRWPSVRLLLTSGHHRLDDAALPDDGRFLPKPWSENGLVSMIRDALDGRQGQHSL